MLYLASFKKVSFLEGGFNIGFGYRLVEAESKEEAHLKLKNVLEVKNKVKLQKIEITEVIR